MQVGKWFAFFDLLIVASALEAGCSTLPSEDMPDGQLIDERLTIRNPFVIAPGHSRSNKANVTGPLRMRWPRYRLLTDRR